MQVLVPLLFSGLVAAFKRSAADINNDAAKRSRPNEIDVLGEVIPFEMTKMIAFPEIIISPLSFAFASCSKTYYHLFTECALNYCISWPALHTQNYIQVLNAALRCVEGMSNKKSSGKNYAHLFLSAGSSTTSPIILESFRRFQKDQEALDSFWAELKQYDVGHTVWPSLFSIFYPSHLISFGLFKVAYPWIKLERNKEVLMTYLAVSVSRSVFASFIGLNGANPNHHAAVAENEQLVEFLILIFEDHQFAQMKRELMQDISDAILFFSNSINFGISAQYFLRIFGEALPPSISIHKILARLNDANDPDYLYRIMAIGYLLRVPVEFHPQRWGALNQEFGRCHERFLADTLKVMSGNRLETIKEWSLTRKIGVASGIPRISTTDALQSIARSIWTISDQPTIEFLGVCVASQRQRSRLFDGLLEQLHEFGPSDNLIDRFSAHLPILSFLELNAADFPQAFSAIMSKLDYELYHYIWVAMDEEYTGKMCGLVTKLPVFGNLVKKLIEGSPRLSPLKGHFATALPSLNIA